MSRSKPSMCVCVTGVVSQRSNVHPGAKYSGYQRLNQLPHCFILHPNKFHLVHGPGSACYGSNGNPRDLSILGAKYTGYQRLNQLPYVFPCMRTSFHLMGLALPGSTGNPRRSVPYWGKHKEFRWKNPTGDDQFGRDMGILLTFPIEIQTNDPNFVHDHCGDCTYC